MVSKAWDPQYFVSLQLPSWVPRWHEESDGWAAHLPSHFDACSGRELSLSTKGDEPYLSLVLKGYLTGSISSILPTIDARAGRYKKDFTEFFASCRKSLHSSTVDSLARAMTAGGRKGLLGSLDSITAFDDNDFEVGLTEFMQTSSTDLETINPTAEHHLGGLSFDFALLATEMCRTRRLFQTQSGFVGMGSVAMQAGDLVVVLFGARWPFIIRPSGDPQSQQYVLVGTAYVDGIMEGEAVLKYEASGDEAHTFEIV